MTRRRLVVGILASRRAEVDGLGVVERTERPCEEEEAMMEDGEVIFF